MSGIRNIRYWLYPVCVKSGMGYVAIPDIRSIWYSLYPVCVNSGLRQKNPKGDPFVTWKNSPKNVISSLLYIRNSLNPVCAKSRMGCVILEGDSIAIITALKISPRTFYPVYVTAYTAYKICHLVGPKKLVL